MGKIFLVGAGPGDEGLVTVKGLEKIKECDVIIYDRLASDGLLNYVKKDCIKIDVGKKPGSHTMKQEEINDVLVKYGREYESVVRLKGGDPFVFGRGGEEIISLLEAGLEFEVIPGVTSAIAVPETAGIPVTHRGVSRSFHVITGHTKEENTIADKEYELYAKLEGTLVFLMGLAHIEKISSKLIAYGKCKETPVAVIANGTTVNEKKVVGNLENISCLVREAGLKSPVIIVVGETASFNLLPKPRKILYGVGTKETLYRFEKKIVKHNIPCKFETLIGMKTVPLNGMSQLEYIIANDIKKYSWILFSSRQAVKKFFNAWKNSENDIRMLAGIKVAAIGTGTAAKLLEYGLKADFIPERQDAVGLSELVVSKCIDGEAAGKKEKVLIPEAAKSSLILEQSIKAAGIDVTAVKIYDVEPEKHKIINYEDVHDVVLFSGSGAKAFFDSVKDSVCNNNTDKKYQINLFAMGKTTIDEIKNQIKSVNGIECHIFKPDEQNIESTAELIWRHYNEIY